MFDKKARIKNRFKGIVVDKIKEEKMKKPIVKKATPKKVAPKKPTVKKPVAKKSIKALVAHSSTKKPITKKPLVARVTPTKVGQKPVQKSGLGNLEQNFGKAPSGVPTYEPILNFNPANPPSGYILVKMNHELLDSMLEKLSRAGNRVQAIGVPCKRV